MKIEAVCFDMDGTLIRNTDSVRYLCALNGATEELEAIEELESNGTHTWIDADYLKAWFIRGLCVAEAEDGFERSIVLVQNLAQVLDYLKASSIESVLITAGPIQVARALATRYGFDGFYGSQYGVKNGRFTGEITNHMGNAGKVKCLREFCLKNGIRVEHCVAIGDSESDIQVFKNCGRSIAINYSQALEGRASEHIVTEDLSDLIRLFDTWLAE